MEIFVHMRARRKISGTGLKYTTPLARRNGLPLERTNVTSTGSAVKSTKTTGHFST